MLSGSACPLALPSIATPMGCVRILTAPFSPIAMATECASSTQLRIYPPAPVQSPSRSSTAPHRSTAPLSNCNGNGAVLSTK